MISACFLAVITMPDFRYAIRKLYLIHWKHVEEAIERIPRGHIAKILDIIMGYISHCSDWFGMLSAGWGIVNSFGAKGLTFPFYLRISASAVIALEGAVKNYFFAPSDHVQNPSLTYSQSAYLNVSNAIKVFVGALCFMMLLDSALFITKDHRDSKVLSIIYYTLLVIIWLDGILNYFFPLPNKAEENESINDNLVDIIIEKQECRQISFNAAQKEKEKTGIIKDNISQLLWSDPIQTNNISQPISNGNKYLESTCQIQFNT